MKLILGSVNPTKKRALKSVVSGDFGYGYLIKDLPVESGVSRQPLSLDETLTGAKNRSEGAFGLELADFGVGIESGVYELQDHLFQTSFCSFYNGERHFVGQGASYVHPHSVHLLVKEGISVGQAYRRLDLTRSSELGSEEGAIGIISRGRMTREQIMFSAVEQAFFRLRYDLD